MKCSTRRTDHDLDHDLDHLDHLDPNLPLSDAVQDLYSTDPTQDHVLDHADYTTPTPQHELGRTDQEIDLP